MGKRDVGGNKNVGSDKHLNKSDRTAGIRDSKLVSQQMTDIKKGKKRKEILSLSQDVASSFQMIYP